MMTPIEIIKAVNGKAITVRAALQIIKIIQEEITARRVLDYYKKRNHA